MSFDRRNIIKLTAAMGAVLAILTACSSVKTTAPAATKSVVDVFPAWTDNPYIHWSAHVSLYSAKTRSYMVKKGIHFTETTPYAGVAGDKDRWDNVIMKTKGFFSIPVLDLPDGTFVSDTTGIIRSGGAAPGTRHAAQRSSYERTQLADLQLRHRGLVLERAALSLGF